MPHIACSSSVGEKAAGCIIFNRKGRDKWSTATGKKGKSENSSEQDEKGIKSLKEQKTENKDWEGQQ